MTTTFYGQDVAVAGMKTACGATLIASQFLDTGEWGGGATPHLDDNNSIKASQSIRATDGLAQGVASQIIGSFSESALTDKYDDRYILISMSDGRPLINTTYAIERGDGSVEHGTTDANGYTHLLKRTLEAEHVRIYLEEFV